MSLTDLREGVPRESRGHPSSLDLEAFACGEPSADVATHLDACDACRAFVDRLKGALGAGPSKARAAETVARAAQQSSNVVSISERRRTVIAAATVIVPLLVAAALLLVLRRPPINAIATLVTPPAAASSESAPAALAFQEPSAEPGVSFKGGLQIAIVRERGADQVRFTGSVAVRPNDRLRVEVALDREQAILAGVLGDDGSWLELMADATKPPGTYFSERSARVDASPLRGTVLVGAPAAVELAQTTRRFDGVASIRIDWEAP